jgi:hypothetical protein
MENVHRGMHHNVEELGRLDFSRFSPLRYHYYVEGSCPAERKDQTAGTTTRTLVLALALALAFALALRPSPLAPCPSPLAVAVVPPTDNNGEVVLGFYELFRIALPEFSKPNAPVLPYEANFKITDPKLNRRVAKRMNLLDNYVAAILVAFLNAGLIQSLVNLGTRKTGYRINATKERRWLGKRKAMKSPLVMSLYPEL